MENDGGPAAAAPPIACTLPEREQRARGEAIAAGVARGCREVRELADGYAFRYPGDEEWAAKLLEFVLFERACCPFFTFELVCESQEGPIWLRLRGPEGAKDFIKGFAWPAGLLG